MPNETIKSFLEKLNILLTSLNGIKRRRFIGRKSNSELLLLSYIIDS